MSPQLACLRGCIVTLVAFVGFFSTVCFQMFPQIACMICFKVTLVTFVCLFSTVCFQVCPQVIFARRCILTLIAFVCFFSTACFQVCLQMACQSRWKVTLGCYFSIFGLTYRIFVNGLAFACSMVYKIFIHRRNGTNVTSVVSCPILVSNWWQIKIMNWIWKKKLKVNFLP